MSASKTAADGWRRWFETPIRGMMRPSRGVRDLTLVVDEDADGPHVVVWDGAAGAALAGVGRHHGDLYEALVTVDGENLLIMRDDNGSEVGHVWKVALDGSTSVDLTPSHPPYTVRGLDQSGSGAVAITTVVVGEYSVCLVVPGGLARTVYSSRHEAWNGLVSADGSLVSVDTTSHNPGVRRFAVTVVDAQSGERLAVLTDGPLGPVRALRFSPVPGDPRLLVVSEQTGFARPAIWNPLTGDRVDVLVPGLVGDVLPLDWSRDGERLLLVHNESGLQQLYEFGVEEGRLRRVPHAPGAVFLPNAAGSHSLVWASHYGPDGRVRVAGQGFDRPLGITVEAAGDSPPFLAPLPAPRGVPARNVNVTSADGTPVQMWVAVPPGARGPVPTIVSVHGGPTWVAVDQFDPAAQAWLEAGFAYVSVNFRGSTTFGRDFREDFLKGPGPLELDDIEAAVRWLREEGIALEGGLFITGASYGGYLTLLALGRRPDLFAGGFAHVAMADWELAYHDANPALQGALRYFLSGSPSDQPERYAASSALTYVKDVRSPVWMGHGTHDSRTPPHQALTYAQQLWDVGGDVVLEWFSGGHGTSSTDQATAYHATMLELAGRAMRGERWSRPDNRPSPPELSSKEQP